MFQTKTIIELATLAILCLFLAGQAGAQDTFQWPIGEETIELPQRVLEGPEGRLTATRIRSSLPTQENAAPRPSKNEQQSKQLKFSVASYTGSLSPTNQLFESAKSDRTFELSATVATGNERAGVQSQQGTWEDRIYTWSAPNFYHRQLYFEQPNFERYGVGAPPLARPLQSTLHFYGSIVLWPVKIIGSPPNEREYSLGHQRPGDISSYQH